MGISAFFRSDEKKTSVFDNLSESQKHDMAVDLYEIYKTIRRWKNFFPEDMFPEVLSELGETGRKIMAKVTMAALQDEVDNLNIQDLIPQALKDVVERTKSMINGS